MNRKKWLLGTIMVLCFVVISACNIPSQAEQELMDMGFTSEEAEEIADFAEELESELEEQAEEEISEEEIEEYVVLPMEEILNAKIGDRIVQFDDQIIPLDGSLTGQEMMDIISESKYGENIEFTNTFASVAPNDSERIDFSSEHLPSGTIIVLNASDEACEPTECAVIYANSNFGGFIPAGGYCDRITDEQAEAGCYTSIITDDIDAFMAEQEFVNKYGNYYENYEIVYINEKMYVISEGGMLQRDTDTGEYNFSTSIWFCQGFPFDMDEGVKEKLIEQDKIKHPEYYQ